jgi:hypothetical protein
MPATTAELEIEIPAVLRNGRTQYQIARVEGHPRMLDVRGVRGARYALWPCSDFDPAAPVWTLITMTQSQPFSYATIIDGEWVVLR